MDTREELVITGIGTILPNTTTVSDFWNNLVEGNSQVDFLKGFDVSNMSVKIASQIEKFNYREFLTNLDEHFAQKYSREIQRKILNLSELALLNHPQGEHLNGGVSQCIKRAKSVMMNYLVAIVLFQG